MEGYNHLPSSVFHQHVTSSLSSRLKNFSAMNSNRRPLSFFLLIFFHNLFNCFAADSISPTQFITDSESITSLNQTFKLGFFSPGNSSYRYVGIWYNTLPGEPAVVWVANRENPLTDSSGVFRIDDTGNLVILSGNTNTVWTTNVSATANNTRAELLESGNLVLRELSFNSSSSGGILWQSFEHPSHTILQDMKFGANTKTGERDVITSWKADSDPTKGRFRLEFEPLNIPQLVLWDGSRRHWRSGPWDGRIFLGVEGMSSDYLNGFSLVRDVNQGIVYTIFSYVKKPLFVRYVLNSAGDIAETRFDEGENQWVEDWSAPQTECDFYGKCGSFGVCDLSSKPVCSCLKGYVPDSIQEWNQRNWSRGCIKSTPLQCEQDGFLKHGRMKVPDFVNWVGGTRDLDDCKQKCLVDCSCTAYAYQTGIGCMSWTGNLIDLEKFSTDGVDLYVRVANSELVRQKNLKLITIIIALLGFITICVCIYIFWRWMKKPNGRRKKHAEFLMLGKHNLTYSENLESEIPTFDYEILAVATDYFSLANKLGEGGFGSVYKGKLPSGQEIAVKRLSKSSGQGTEEFKNEVVVISGLQHRNLVRLLGCCIEGEEKMLIYEHMPNKSLDAFLFDPLKRGLLSWRTRFQIIVGIGRGILYLHRDSRLKVIHRDLKPSNILLDKDLNPKISDFGMARIFGVDELQANTIRVVGTYGYMSPEYAMEGVFSEKSDVYSFGVLLLEIITGLRNTGFYHHEESLSLIQHVWKLWNQGETRVLIDCTISEPSSDEEILRHIHVGLLCVQDLAKDRPNMSPVISMLTSEILSLPTPKQAAFTWRQGSSDYDSSNCGHKNGSINNVSITTIGGR